MMSKKEWFVLTFGSVALGMFLYMSICKETRCDLAGGVLVNTAHGQKCEDIKRLQ